MRSLLLRGLGAALLSSVLAPAQVSYFTAALDGASEVPPVATSGGGFAIVRLAEPANSVEVFAHWFGLSGTPTAAHLHLAPAGVNGPVIVPLTAGPGDTFAGTGTLSAAQVTALKSDGTYVNVHTPANPGGEIRGQVVAAASTRLTAVLSGANEVPPNTSTATGTAIAFLHEPDNRLVYVVESSGLVNVTAAHVHEQMPGMNGPIVFPLNGSAGQYCGVSDRLTAAQVATLLAGGMYVNVHTTANPGGEIRGQLTAAADQFVAALDGAQEVPPVTTPGSGAACLTIDPAGSATIVVSYAGLTTAATMAHIHDGAVGVNGPIAVPLTASGPGEFSATFTPTTAELAQLRGGNWYVNVHTGTNPGGEIRGQLEPAGLPATYGLGCPGSSGVRPEIDASLACLGTTLEIDLYGARPSTLVLLGVGFDRDRFLGLSLPLPFAALSVQAPCFLLTAIDGSRVAITDATGCASLPIQLPFVPAYRGATIYGQWFVYDPQANARGIVTSNAVSIPVQ